MRSRFQIPVPLVLAALSCWVSQLSGQLGILTPRRDALRAEREQALSAGGEKHCPPGGICYVLRPPDESPLNTSAHLPKLSLRWFPDRRLGDARQLIGHSGVQMLGQAFDFPRRPDGASIVDSRERYESQYGRCDHGRRGALYAATARRVSAGHRWPQQHRGGHGSVLRLEPKGAGSRCCLDVPRHSTCPARVGSALVYRGRRCTLKENGLPYPVVIAIRKGPDAGRIVRHDSSTRVASVSSTARRSTSDLNLLPSSTSAT